MDESSDTDRTNASDSSKQKEQPSTTDDSNTRSSSEDTSSTGSQPLGTKRKRSSLLRSFFALEKDIENIEKTVKDFFVSKDEDEQDKAEEVGFIRDLGLSPSMAAIIVFSCTTGSGMASLPYALKESSWFGVFLLLLCGFNALYATLCLGWSWSIMEERWPEYEADTRVPYQDMAVRAVGSWMNYIVAICIHVTILGQCGLYMLTISGFVQRLETQVGFCQTLLVTAIILALFICHGNYSSMKYIAILDLFSSILLTILLIVALFIDKPTHGASRYSDPSLNSESIAFAIFSFAYGAGGNFPTVMADMTDRRSFPHSAATGYMIILTIYLIISILGYAAYGDHTPRNILLTFTSRRSKVLYGTGYALAILYIIQLATTFALLFMPTLLAAEEAFNCPREFGSYRIMIRLGVQLILLLLVLGVPYLSIILDLVSATTVNLLSYVFPVVFYACLATQKAGNFPKRNINKKEWLLLCEVILLGIIAGVISTYASIKQIIVDINNPARLFISCYEDMSLTTRNISDVF